MNINNLYEVYFSPTGGTKEAVEVFGAQWSIAKSVVDLADMNVEFDKYEFYNDDLCIIGVPVFGGRAPAVAIQRIKELKGNNTPVVIIATYGNRAYGDTLIELQQVVEELGFCVVAALAVVTQHSIVPQYGFGRPDALDKTRLVEMSIKIKVHIERAAGFNTARLSEKKPLREYKGSPLKPANVGKCINCGICAQNCPVGAIPLDNPKATETEKCISCMRCVNKCPKSSRKVSEVKVSALANKIKKECLGRKEIEIFVNKNLNNDMDRIYDKTENIPKEIEINNNAITDEIEEISVSHIAIEDAKQDINSDGIQVSEKSGDINEEMVQETYEQPTYEETVQETYEQPTYEEAVQETYEQPTYEETVQETYEQPTYEETVQETYEQPTYEEAVQETYEEPTYGEAIQEPYVEPVHKKGFKRKGKLPNTFADIQKLFGKVYVADNPIESNAQENEIQQEVQRQQEEIERQQEIQRQHEEMERQQEIQRQHEEMERQQEIQRQHEEMERQQEIQRQQEEIERQQEIQRQHEEMERQQEIQRQHEEMEIQQEPVEQEILDAEQLEDIPDEFVLPEPEEITMPENMKDVSLDDIENDPYELDEELLDYGEIEEIMELDEIVEQESPEVEHPKDFVLNIDTELEDIKEDIEEVVEEIEDEIGIILEDV